MTKIKKLVLRTGLLIIISTCGCSLQKQSETNDYNLTETLDINEINNQPDNDTIVTTPSAIINNNPITTPLSLLITQQETQSQITTTSPCEIVEDNRLAVSLTFDDGPSAYTEDLLNLLNEYNIKATFFVIKYNCEKYPEKLVTIQEYGHEIAIHGATHTEFTKLSTDEVTKEIETTIEYIESLGVDASEIVRPPYGSINNKIRQNIAYPFVNWDIDTEDWKTKNKNKIKNEILDNIHEGAIILMHDNHSQKVHEANIAALNEILPELIKEYKFVTITELCEDLNVELENGKSYRKIKNEN